MFDKSYKKIYNYTITDIYLNPEALFMIRSMTGYGRATQTVGDFNICVELKSVNHRFLEFSARVPRLYGFLEEKCKSYIQSMISRGKVECFVMIEALGESDCTVEINHSLAKGYIDALKQLSETYGLADDITVSSVAKYSDIFSVRKAEADEEAVWQSVKTVLDEAVSAFIAMREKEGEKLRDDILSRCDLILDNVAFIEQRSPETVKEYNEKLLERMKTVLDTAQIDEQRILLEAAVYADKIAVAEETVRLRSHISQMKEFLESDKAVGRKMDFLVQEFNREANTIGSKAQDVEIAKRVIDIKAEVEKIREQVQNIE